MKERLEKIKESGLSEIGAAETAESLEAARVKLLGKKGELMAVLRGMGALSAEERPQVGQAANSVRAAFEAEIEKKKAIITARERESSIRAEKIDVTLPGKKRPFGGLHPLTKVMWEIEDIFIGMGFSIAEGPDIETEYYNFEALNIPADHSARDIEDTFYIDERLLLRTQTSPVQIRVMEREKPPIKIIAPGRVYRPDAVDATHSPVFHQIEGLVVDRGITMADLKGTLEMFVKKLYGADSKVRFRPHHFQFTEPSAEMDVSCFVCGGSGCGVCKGEGWIEILGCGMVHPKVLKGAGIDPGEFSGFAFGLGLERIVMRRYNIDDLRLFTENDLRFLKQF